MNEIAIVYVGGALVLFFFWVYGIVSFIVDVKNVLVPGMKQLLKNRQTLKEEREEEYEREDQERQLY